MSNSLRHPKIVIIGAGMTGILMAIKCREKGIQDIVVLEKAGRIGGTWRENTYPGVACDVPAHMYTYSFAMNPDWSRYYAGGSEIQGYFEAMVQRYNLEPLIHCNEEVTASEFNNGQWLISTSAGRQYQADFVFCATGILHHPAYPDIKGLASFKGKVFHTARWNHDVTFDPSVSVGVIGNGSTAAQFIPELVKTGAQVSVFMRTPQWIVRIPDRSIMAWERFLLKHSVLMQRLYRWASTLLIRDFFNKALAGAPIRAWLLDKLVRLNLRFSVKDKDLRDQLTPDFQVGCKRVIVNTTFYKAMQQGNAHLVRDGIAEVTPDGLLMNDGTLHQCDVLVLSTGFKALSYMRPMALVGDNNVAIDEAWKDKIEAYHSVLLKDYPNFFLMLGPHTPIANFSVIAMSEVQGDYIMQLIDAWMLGDFDTVAPQQEAVDRYQQFIRDGLKGSTWASGCQSWYLDADGDAIVWPYSWDHYVKVMASPVLADLDLRHVESSSA